MRLNLVVTALLLMIVGAAVFSIVKDVARQSQFGPICDQHGWIIIDTGPMQKPKCLDERTGLMYVPAELQNK